MELFLNLSKSFFAAFTYFLCSSGEDKKDEKCNKKLIKKSAYRNAVNENRLALCQVKGDAENE